MKFETLLKSEVAISSRFSQLQQPTFFVICTRFIRLMVPTGLIVAVKQNTNFVPTVSWHSSSFVLFCFPSLSALWAEQLSRLQIILFKSLGVWFNCPYQTGGYHQTYKSSANYKKSWPLDLKNMYAVIASPFSRKIVVLFLWYWKFQCCVSRCLLPLEYGWPWLLVFGVFHWE